MIADSAGGVRFFSSFGWDGDSLTWIGVSDRTLKEKFVYTKLDAATLRSEPESIAVEMIPRNP